MTEPDEIDVEVQLQRDHRGPGSDFDELVPAGTWVTGWMRRSDWRRGESSRWEVLVHYSVTHRGMAFNYLDTFDQDHIRRATTERQSPTQRSRSGSPPQE